MGKCCFHICAKSGEALMDNKAAITVSVRIDLFDMNEPQMNRWEVKCGKVLFSYLCKEWRSNNV